ncbi:hypothetical protein AGLY_009971 [Aphis glycines]|uniref:Uncharacterized protein n=1 Tax=Aphis glycines TaxID=307491 RepID=A0A6G0TIB0_APHGL|nr:hypothetical protein AGLY_009971 [Aphis glycines]
MIEQTTLRNILTWIIAVILFIFQSLNYFISRIKKFVKHGQKNTTVVTTDTIISSESNPNNNNAPENVITVQGLIQKHFDIPLIIAEDEPKVNDFIKNAQLLNSYDNYKEKKKIDQFMEHLVDDSYVARGLGLITANVGREAEFYLYSKYDNNFENIVIKLKGRQGEIGQITIPNQNPTNSIETKSIPMDYFYDEDRIKVTYTPFAEGVYTLTLVRNGLSICRSPYYISVEKSPTNSRSQIRLGTKKYKTVTKFAKAKHVPLETCDNSIPVIEPRKSSISRNILPATEENSIRTDVMSIVTKFESNSIHLKKNDQKLTVKRSKKSTKTDLFDEISISADSNTQPKIETGNDYDTNINDLSSISINSNSKSNDKKFSSNLDVSNRNSKSNYINSKEIESHLVKKSNKKLDESIRNINDMPRVKNMSSNHLEPTNSVLLKEHLNDKSLDDVEKHNQTYITNEPIHGQNQSEAFLDPITVDKFEIKCIDNEAYTHNEISCFDDDHGKTVILMKNINELETHPNISMNQQLTDSTQYNINTPFTSVLTKITNDVCEKCSIKVLRILSEFPRDINITHNNNSNENCSSHETVLAQPFSINTNIDNLFEKPISPTNEHKTDNLLTNSPTNMKLMDTIDKDIKYNYINEIKPINTTFNEIYCDINNTTKELMVKKNKHYGEINKTINDKITNNFTIPLTKTNINKHKIDHLENILSTDNKMQIQVQNVQNVQKFSEHNMDKDQTNQFQFHEYINNELNDINKENEKILDTRDILTINNDKKFNEELIINELKAKNVIIPDEYKNNQSSFINSQTVLASMEDKLLTLRYKPEDIRQEIRNIPNTNVILHENQKLIIENLIEPVLKNFKNKMVEKITELYLNRDLTSSDNISILENYNINLTNNLQKNQLHNNADNKKNKTKLIEIIRSQLTNHFHKNNIPGLLNNKKTDNNQVYKYLENIIKTNMNPNETHSQRLDENNIQTLVSIAKNQLNKQQLDDEFKMMTLENVTSNFEIKKTKDDEKIQDTDIKLKNIPNDMSIKIEATTKSIKSNTSEETDLGSNIDNKKNIKSIKLKNKVNDLTKIQNLFKINEIEENNNRNTTIKSKPTENASREQIKKPEDKVVKIKIFNDAKDLTTEKKNIYTFPHSVIVTVNKENKTSTIIDTSRVPEIKLEKINNSAQSDTSKFNNPFIKPQIQKIVVEIVTNNNKLVVDSVAIIIHEETEDEKKVAKKNNPKTKYWIQINDHELYTINAYHDTIKPIDKDRVIETKMPKISTQTDITIENNLKKSNKKEIEENIKNDLIIETPTISLQNSEKLENINETKITPYTVSSTEQIEETIAVESESCLLIDTSNVSVEQKTIIRKSKEHPISIENRNKSVKESKVIKTTTETELIKNSDSLALNKEEETGKENNPETEIETEKPIYNIIKESEVISLNKITTVSDDENIKIKNTGEHQLTIETKINCDENLKVVNNNTESASIPNNDSSTVNVEETIEKENIPETEVKTKKSEDKNNKEGEPCPPTTTQNISTDEKITIEETTEEPLTIETPIRSVEELKVVDIKTETEPSPNTDSSSLNVLEPIDKENITETEVETKEEEDNTNKEIEPCLLNNTQNISTDEKITIEETTEKALTIETPIQSVEELKVVDIKTETEPSPNSDSSSLNVLEPIDKENIPETEVETIKAEDNINKEGEPWSPTNTKNISTEEKITIEETTEEPLPIVTPIQSVEESKVLNTNTESELITNNDSSAVNVEETIEKENIPETEVETKNLEDKNNKEGEPCPPTNTQNISTDEKITIEETTEEPLTIETPIQSVEELKVVNIKTETEPSPNTDSSSLNVLEPIDKENITETEVETKEEEDKNNKEGEPCPPTNTQNISTEEKITIEETIEEPLLIETPIQCVEESKVLNTNTESELITNNDSSAVNVEETIEKENIPETEVETKKSEDKNNKEGEPYPPTNTQNISTDEKITIEETTEEPLTIETPIQSVEELKVLNTNTESELITNNDSSAVNVEETIEKENIPETEVETKNLEDKNNKEGEPCPPTNTQNISTEEKITIEERTEEPLTIETPIQSVEKLKVVDIKTDTEPSPNSDSSSLNVLEPIDKENITETEVETKEEEDNTNKEIEPCLLKNTQNISTDEKITIEERTEKALTIETPIQSVEELKVVDIKTETEPSPNSDSSSLNVLEPIDKENIPETEVETIEAEDNINKEGEPWSPTNTKNISTEEKITIEETTEEPLTIETPIQSVEELKVVNIKTETEPSPNTDSSSLNVLEPIDKENITETEVETKEEEDKNNKEGEPCPPTNTQNISTEEKTTIEETIEEPLLIETPIHCVEESKVLNTNTESELITNNDSSAVNVEETIEKENIPETEVETKKSEDKNNKEGEPYPPTNTQNISTDEKITIEETTEEPLTIETPIQSVEELKVVDIKTETEPSPNSDSSSLNVLEPIDKENIPETEVETIKAEDNINKEGEPWSPTNTKNISTEEKITIEETTEEPLPIVTPIQSVEESKVLNTNTESELITNNDSSAVNVEETIEKENIPETEVETKNLEDKNNKEGEPCPPTNTQNISTDEKITIEETTEEPLTIETPIQSVEELKVVNIKTETEPSPNTDSSSLNVLEPIDKENITETEVETKEEEDKNNKEGEPCPPTNTQNISTEEKITIEETIEEPLLIETPIHCVEESKVLNTNTESELITNNDSSAVNVEETIEKENIPETEVETKKSEDKNNKEGEPYPPTNTQNISTDEKITIEETTEEPLTIETPIQSVEELKAVDIKTETEPSPNTDSSSLNVLEPIDKENITETEVETKEEEDNTNKEIEPCPLKNTQNISTDEKITIEETTEEPLTIETPIQSVEELKVVNIKTETEPSPNTDSSSLNILEPIDKENITETEVETKEEEDKNNKEGEPCPPTNTQNISTEEKITIEERTEEPLTIETPIQSVEKLKVVDIKTDTEPSPNSDSSSLNVLEPIDKENITETEVETIEAEDNINKEGEPWSPTNTKNISTEEKITIEETIEEPLLIETPINCVEESKVLNTNTESELITNNDSSAVNVEETIEKENIPETEVETKNLEDKNNKEGEPRPLTNTPNISTEEKITFEETTEEPLPFETPIKSVEELKVVYINTESELVLNNDSSMINVEKPFNKDNVPEIQIETVKTIDENEKECEACSPIDTSSVSIEEKNIIDKSFANPLLNEPPMKSVEKFKAIDINTETEPSPNTDSLTGNIEVLIDKENIREIQIETDKLIDYSNKECKSCSLADKLAASGEENNFSEETMEILLPIETFIKSSIKAVGELKVNKINTETVFVPNIDSLTLNAEEQSEKDYFSKIVIKTDKRLDFVVKECETCPPIDTSMYVTEEIKGIDSTIEKLIPIGPSFVIADTENLTLIDGINTIVNRQSGKKYLKDIESSTRIDTVAFVKDQKVEENETLIENILTINTSTASVQGQIQVEEVIKDDSVILINDSVTFDEMSPEEQKKIETTKISSITVMEEQTDINRGEVMYTCEEPLDKTIVEKSIHSETTSTTDILVAVDEQRALETEVSKNATQVLNDTFTETVENLIKTKKKFEKETTTPIVVAKSEVEWNEIKLVSENKTSTPVHLASTNKEQTEIDMVTEIASPNVNILNSNTKIILVDKEIITENSNNPKHCYLKFGETSKIHSLENEDNLPGKSYGIQKLEMSVQRMKTSNEDYYEKTFLQLEQTEKISVENKDKVDCENKNIIDDKLYTVNESDLNAILSASSLEEALTLLDSKIKFKFKHRKLSNKANSTPHIPKIQSSESRSSGTNTNFTDAQEFFKEIEKKCKK